MGSPDLQVPRRLAIMRQLPVAAVHDAHVHKLWRSALQTNPSLSMSSKPWMGTMRVPASSSGLLCTHTTVTVQQRSAEQAKLVPTARPEQEHSHNTPCITGAAVEQRYVGGTRLKARTRTCLSCRAILSSLLMGGSVPCTVTFWCHCQVSCM